MDPTWEVLFREFDPTESTSSDPSSWNSSGDLNTGSIDSPSNVCFLPVEQQAINPNSTNELLLVNPEGLEGLYDAPLADMEKETTSCVRESKRTKVLEDEDTADKRKRNQQAARKFRAKKKDYIEQLEQELKTVLEENRALKMENDRLKNTLLQAFMTGKHSHATLPDSPVCNNQIPAPSATPLPALNLLPTPTTLPAPTRPAAKPTEKKRKYKKYDLAKVVQKRCEENQALPANPVQPLQLPTQEATMAIDHTRALQQLQLQKLQQQVLQQIQNKASSQQESFSFQGVQPDDEQTSLATQQPQDKQQEFWQLQSVQQQLEQQLQQQEQQKQLQLREFQQLQQLHQQLQRPDQVKQLQQFLQQQSQFQIQEPQHSQLVQQTQQQFQQQLQGPDQIKHLQQFLQRQTEQEQLQPLQLLSQQSQEYVLQKESMQQECLQSQQTQTVMDPSQYQSQTKLQYWQMYKQAQEQIRNQIRKQIMFQDTAQEEALGQQMQQMAQFISLMTAFFAQQLVVVITPSFFSVIGTLQHY
eukprot:TRINITY_DN416_c0_g1_i1.p1 TRINITY_DN416_c0_g1~~TRINITY_DN416_c0_g1_i1.p1  ORF type:complete len:571 (-),score=152.72 TRINITY_DN416_c0_g1_i1:178-1761(-)